MTTHPYYKYVGEYGIATIAQLVNTNEWELDGWGDWTERFPRKDMAVERFRQLIDLDLTTDPAADRMFAQTYQQFIADRLGWRESHAWRWRDYIKRMESRGFPVTIFDSGGGILLCETRLGLDADGGNPVWILWADDSEGYARFGLYHVDSAKQMSDVAFMHEEPDQTELDARFASIAADLCDQITAGAQRLTLDLTRRPVRS